MKMCLWIGTYTCAADSGVREKNHGRGIYAYIFDDSSNRAVLQSVYENCKNPSYLARDRDHLYAVSELADGGCVTALRYNARSGEFTYVNQQAVPGSGACHVTVWKEKHSLVVANYLSGSMLSYALGEDGSIGDMNGWFRFEGRGEDPARQEGPHAHSSIVTPDGQALIVADLGTDRLRHYRWDESGNRPVQDSVLAETYIGPGEGPRHMCFSPDGRYMYLVTELKSSVICYGYSRESHGLARLQKVSSLPAGYMGYNIAADIHMPPDGRYLYVSERGADQISVFPVVRETGRLGEGAFYPCGGKCPRNFCISPCGRYIVIANQDSGNVVIYRRNQDSGAIEEMIEEIQVSSPVCVKMMNQDEMLRIL